MAARLEGYITTTAVLGGNEVMKVHQWHCFSQPSETYFEFRARTTTTRAGKAGRAQASRIAWRFEPRPEARTPTASVTRRPADAARGRACRRDSAEAGA